MPLSLLAADLPGRARSHGRGAQGARRLRTALAGVPRHGRDDRTSAQGCHCRLALHKKTTIRST